MTSKHVFGHLRLPARWIYGNRWNSAHTWTIEDTAPAGVGITDLNSPRKSATLRTRCMVKEDLVIDGEAVVLVPTRA